MRCGTDVIFLVSRISIASLRGSLGQTRASIFVHCFSENPVSNFMQVPSGGVSRAPVAARVEEEGVRKEGDNVRGKVESAACQYEWEMHVEATRG